ncbi:hypothetical protein O6H91_08G093000 [Diphasiastrum complanatum]|uniref:Uncharacterized protein n=1 Tax=Diphasiastrum complanatum TaxID=34168 RepID=A0ACC2CZY7_DIPCM|nr:hypothetical protein O6H91_08G093000 [Diphasiastrum complanatum]
MGGDTANGAPPPKRMKLHMPSIEEAFPHPMDGVAVPAVTIDALGSKGQIKKIEFTRIITQALYSLGYNKSASLLETESGIPLHSAIISQFRMEILQGLWDESLKTLHNLSHLDPETLKSAAFLILQQKFLEQLHRGETDMALKTLRSQLSKLKIRMQRLHELASCIICPTREDILAKVEWRGGGAEANMSLLLHLQSLLPPDIMIPEKRLEGLIEQALSVQRKACMFHNSLDQALTLYTDHCCGRDQIPTQTIQVLDAHEDEVWFLQFSHNGKHLASASKDCTAIIWNVGNDDFVMLKHTLTGHQKPVAFVAWSPDDIMLLTCGTEEVVRLWNAESGDCLRTYTKPTSGFTSCAWFPDGRKFVTGGGDRCIDMWDLNGNELDSWKGVRMPRITDVAITSDGVNMVSLAGNKDIRIHNLKEKSEHVIEEEGSITSLSFSNDSKHLLVNLSSQEIHLWDITANEKLPYKFKGHRQGRYVIRSCFGGSDHAFIVSGSEDSQVYIWHRGNGELLEVLPGHAGTVNCVSWNPTNPHMFASASDDSTIRIWGLSTKAPRVRATGTSNGIHPLINGVTR